MKVIIFGDAAEAVKQILDVMMNDTKPFILIKKLVGGNPSFTGVNDCRLIFMN